MITRHAVRRVAGAFALLLACHQVQAQSVVIYSRADAAHAHRAHALASLYAPAFIDRQLPPGAPWRSTIAAAICSAGVVLVLWSERAAASADVRREIDTALVCRAPVVPVLLDSTPLPGLLGDTNAVDWR